MLNIPGGLESVIWTVQSIVILITALALWRWQNPRISRRAVLWVGVGWTMFITSEFWLIGPWSYIHNSDEGELLVPYFRYLADWHLGGSYMHGFMGGADATIAFQSGGALVPIETALFTLFPNWIVLSLNKILVVGLGFAGGYLLARRGAGIDRFSSVAVALTFTVTHRYLISATIANGFIGYAWLPFALYVFIFEVDRRNYIWLAGGVAAIISLTATPTHSLMAIGTGLPLLWLFNSARRPLRFWTAYLTLLVTSILNWGNKIFAMVMAGGASERFNIVDQAPGLGDFVSMSVNFLSRSAELTLLLFVVVAATLLTRWQLALKLVSLLWAPALLAALLTAVPWQTTPVPFLSGLSFEYMTLAIPAFLVLAGAYAVSFAGAEKRLSKVVAVSFAAVAIAQAMGLKVSHGAQWLGLGGGPSHVKFGEVFESTSPAGAPLSSHVRTATIPYRLRPNITAAYGRWSVDGFVSLMPQWQTDYWEKGYWKGSPPGQPANIAHHTRSNFTCCQSYDAAKVLNLDALRVGGVQQIASVLPLNGRDIRLETAQDQTAVTPRAKDPVGKKILGFLRANFTDEHLRIYTLEESLPMAFVPSAIENWPTARGGSVYGRVLKKAVDRVATIRSASSTGWKSHTKPAAGRIESVAAVPDGYRIRVILSDPGVIILNAVWTRFWDAWLENGQRLRTAMANGIHTAIDVPEGRHHITILYRRPSLMSLP